MRLLPEMRLAIFGLGGPMNIQQICQVMHRLGAEAIYIKPLAENDNTKQQIYMGGDFLAINIFPLGEFRSSLDTKIKTIKAPMNLHWINSEGHSAPAPGAQLILYPQYPEVRLSGIIKDCPLAPSRLLQPIPSEHRRHNNAKDGRLLILGRCPDGRVLAFLAPAGSAASNEFPTLSAHWQQVGVFFLVPKVATIVDPRAILLERLTEIHRVGWHSSRKLNTSGEVVSYNAKNAGGYTLEALLGIIPNGRSEPDFDNWEVKAYSRNVLTLMTPEPTGGYYGESGVANFLRRYGRPQIGKPATLYFTGTYRVGIPYKTTGMELNLTGYEAAKRAFDPAGTITLNSPEGDLAASWNYASLLGHWNRKHRQAAYVPYQARLEAGVNEFKYNSPVLLGEGTDFSLFLAALQSGAIYYDPASKLETTVSGQSRVKARSQFRIRLADLKQLYTTFGSFPLGDS